MHTLFLLSGTREYFDNENESLGEKKTDSEILSIRGLNAIGHRRVGH